MRAGREPGASDIADDVSGVDVLALAHQDLGLVAIQRGHAPTVVDHGGVAVAPHPAGADNRPGATGVDRIAITGVEVDARMAARDTVRLVDSLVGHRTDLAGTGWCPAAPSCAQQRRQAVGCTLERGELGLVLGP